jgi:DNA-binding LacI/PurR family transcriptional regulator
LAKPKLHTITNAQSNSARIAARKLRSLGYRRIGYASTHEFNEATDGNFLGGFLYEQLHWPAAEQIPVLAPPEKDLVPEFRKWYSLYKPSAIFTVHFGILSALTPNEVRNSGIAMHELPEELSIFAGIQQNGRLIGRVAVDEVVALMNSNQRGIPATPKRILIEGFWRDGPSAPRITASPL